MQAVFAPSPLLDVGNSGDVLPLAPWALLLCWGSREPETHPRSALLPGDAELGLRRPSSPRPQQCPPSQGGLHSTEVPAPQRHQLSSWVLQSAKGQEKLLGEHTPAPPRLCSGKQSKPFSHPARRSQSGKAGLGCLWLPEPCCFAGGLRSLNPTPHVFSFTGKQDGTCIGLLRPCPSNTAQAKLGHSAPRPQLPKGTNRVPGPCSLQRDRKHSSRSNTSPTAPFLRKATQAVFAPSPPLDVGKSGAGLPLAPWALSLLGVSGA